ncbi:MULTISPECIES: PP2C family protein-serine/threonine phosphatase [Amycolatopsis]|uniref:Cyclic diguanylate phosphodiesterase n=1 Tax=Amycolatopsis bullii TaxID=941987 RepID=A0ABQ3KFG7_9PSEU|nr:GAF domain-containing SpoIIE family protein phosphatase [Amycolatopsis bullii]GHG08353.1 cyclic diguanylate phosphodiesterase [Amycolatopsis bullii]
MTSPPEFDTVLDAVRRAFVGGDGVPAATAVRALGPAEVRAVLGDHVARAVTDRAALADLVPGKEITQAVAVAADGGERGALVYSTEHVGEAPSAVAAAIEAATAGLAATVRRLRGEAAVLDALHSTGRELTAQLDIDRIVQDATDAATKATGAAFGAFFYNLVDELGESYTLYTISGVPREAFARFPMPRNTEVFGPTFDGAGTVRSPDITKDPRFGKNAPHHGMPEGHLPVCSYLAVSVLSPTSGEVLGGFFFGHPEPDRFTARHEYLAEGIAAYSAIALDNARLYERERTLATELSRSMLPVAPPTPGLDVFTRYLPAATGSKVGGDWFDVLRLPSGATAFVIGDVVGHGVTAATVMGQVRTAVRSYALLELPPSEVLRNVSELAAGLFGESFVTCFYAVHRPADGTLAYANAGHLPAILIRPGEPPEQIGEALAQPLGVGSVFPQRTAGFPVGADLVLYTDGLVESRTRDLTLGIEWLLAGIPGLLAAADLETAWDKLVDELTRGRHDDDIAVIHVHHRGEETP